MPSSFCSTFDRGQPQTSMVVWITSVEKNRRFGNIKNWQKGEEFLAYGDHLQFLKYYDYYSDLLQKRSYKSPFHS